MRILIVNDYGTLTGGAERVSLLLRDGLRARGHEARLFASSARPLGLPSDADVSCFGSESGLRRILQAGNPWAVVALRRVLREFRPDVVHVRMFLTQLSPLILPLLRDRPCLLHAVNYQTICPLNTKVLPDGSLCTVRAGTACLLNRCVSPAGWARTVVQLGLCRHWARVFDRVVANSQWLGRRLQADGLPVTEVVWNGTALHPARPPLAEPPTIAFAGRLVPKKGVPILLQAMARVAARIPAARLVIAGDGEQRPLLERSIGELGLSGIVTLRGHLAQAELEAALRPAWVQVIPSCYEEPFPNVAIEAMMRGTAVVASAAGGATEIVLEGRTGYLVPPADPEPLADRLLLILSSREAAERLGAEGRAVALTEFSEARMVDRFLALYRDLARQTVANQDRPERVRIGS